MPFAPTDPRAALRAPANRAAPSGPVAAPAFADFGDLEPDEVTAAGTRLWIVRTRNAVLAHISPSPGDALAGTALAEEHVVLLPAPDAAAAFTAAGEERVVRGPGLVVLPPGPAGIVPVDAGDLVRLVPATVPGWAARARNASAYAAPDPRVTPAEPWPEPVGGHRLRVHLLADVPEDPARFGRIFRTRHFMVNFLAHYDGPRDRSKLSPHHHDDFEQVSLAVSGSFVHHVRTPWGTDAGAWRDDVHQRVGSPSVAVIPPPTVHTSEAVGPGRNQLVDIFSPPRADFSARPGWVLNAAEYPAPPDRMNRSST